MSRIPNHQWTYVYYWCLSLSLGIENSFDLKNFLDSLWIGWIKLSINSILFSHCFPTAWPFSICWIDSNWIATMSVWIQMYYLSQHVDVFEVLANDLHHPRGPLHCSLEHSTVHVTGVQKPQVMFTGFLALLWKLYLNSHSFSVSTNSC